MHRILGFNPRDEVQDDVIRMDDAVTGGVERASQRSIRATYASDASPDRPAARHASPGEVLDLDAYEVAYLAGGEEVDVNAALVSLVSCQALELNGERRRASYRGQIQPRCKRRWR